MSDLPISLVVELDPVIEWQGGVFKEIELREPKIRELEAALGVMKGMSDGQSSVRFQIALITAVSGKPRQVVEQMTVTQIAKAFEYLQNFMNPQPTNT